MENLTDETIETPVLADGVHPNLVRGPIEEVFNAQRQDIGRRYREVLEEAEATRSKELALNKAGKEQALVEAGLNPDGSTPTPEPPSAEELSRRAEPVGLHERTVTPSVAPDAAPVPATTPETPETPPTPASTPEPHEPTPSEPVTPEAPHEPTPSEPVTPEAPHDPTADLSEAELEAATAPEQPNQ